MAIVITGATGQLGSAVIKYVQQQNTEEKVVAVARDLAKARELFNGTDVEVRFGDYDEPATLPKAFEGASKLLLISSPDYDNSNRIVQHASAVKAARDAGVRHIHYTSYAFAEDSNLPLADLHLATEYAIRVTGIPFTFIRNPLYSDVFINPSLSASVESGELITNAGTGRLNTVSRDDLAKGTAAILASDGHEGKTYNFTASANWTFDQLAVVLGKVSGRPVIHKSVSQDEEVGVLRQAGLPEGMAIFTASTYEAISKGEAEQTSGDLQNLIGEETPFEEFVRRQLA